MRLLYLSTWDFSNEVADGVCKKIYAQLRVFKAQGYCVDFIYIKNNHIYYKENETERSIGKVGTIKKMTAYLKMFRHLENKRYDWIYNRYGMMDPFYYRLLKRLHQNGAKILIEIPTYPYAGERPKGFLYWLMFRCDDLYINRLKKIICRIATYSMDDRIFGIPTIPVKNGIDLRNITPSFDKEQKGDSIHLLMVALMQPCHGYERLLWGLKQYYDKGGSRKIYCHFVGDGPEKGAYEKIVSDCQLDQYVIFYGMKGKEELREIYGLADIGVCTLGGYKKGIYWSSELKSREYLAFGLPVIIGIELDILDKIKDDYYLQVPNDATVIDMEQVIRFYDKVYKRDRNQVAMDIRKVAEENLSIEATMQPIVKYIDQQEHMEEKQ